MAGLVVHLRKCERRARGHRLARATTARALETTLASGPAVLKFDLLQVLDLDEDGDLDVMNCDHG